MPSPRISSFRESQRGLRHCCSVRERHITGKPQGPLYHVFFKHHNANTTPSSPERNTRTTNNHGSRLQHLPRIHLLPESRIPLFFQTPIHSMPTPIRARKAHRPDQRQLHRRQLYRSIQRHQRSRPGIERRRMAQRPCRASQTGDDLIGAR